MEICYSSLLTVALHSLVLTGKAAVYVCIWVWQHSGGWVRSFFLFDYLLMNEKWKIQIFATCSSSPHLASGINSAGLLCVDAPAHLQHRDQECSIQPRVLLCPCFLGILLHHSQEEKQNKNPSRHLQNWLTDLTFRIGYSNTWLPNYCIC